MTDPLLLNLSVALSIVLAGLSLLLLGVSWISFRRFKSLKFLFVGGAFLVLSLEGAFWTYRGIVEREGDLPPLLLDFLVLLFLYLGVASR